MELFDKEQAIILAKDTVMAKTMETHNVLREEASEDIDAYENTISFYAKMPELSLLHLLESFLNEYICLYCYSRRMQLLDEHFDSMERIPMENAYARVIKSNYEAFKSEFERLFPGCNINCYPIAQAAKNIITTNSTPTLARPKVQTPIEVYRDQKSKAVEEFKKSHPTLAKVESLVETVIGCEDCHFHISDENIELVRLVRALSIIENSDSTKKAELGQYIVDALKAKLSDEVYIKNPNNEFVKELINTAIGNPSVPGSPIVERTERVDMALKKAVTSSTYNLT